MSVHLSYVKVVLVYVTSWEEGGGRVVIRIQYGFQALRLKINILAFIHILERHLSKNQGRSNKYSLKNIAVLLVKWGFEQDLFFQYGAIKMKNS